MIEQESSSSIDPVANEKNIEQSSATGTESKSTTQTQSSSDESQSIDASFRYYLAGLGFIGLLILSFIVIVVTYLSFHSIDFVNMFKGQVTLVEFGFIGGSPNPFSIGIEIIAWSTFGVNCQMAYLAGRAVMRGQFGFLKYLIRWISTSLFAWGIAVAVIFSLQVVSLKVSGIEITLADASIETIIAISFVLGYFNEEARKLLGNLRGKIAVGLEDERTQSTPRREASNSE